MTVTDAIRAAEALLPGREASSGNDPRWQAIIAVGTYVATDPEPIWEFARRWASVADPDLRAAVATCLLEHLLEHHFDALYPRVADAVAEDSYFADCFSQCWPLGEAGMPANRRRFEALQERARAI